MATSEFTFDFKLDLTIEPIVEQPEITEIKLSDSELSMLNSKQFFNAADYPLAEKTSLDIAREEHAKRNGKLVNPKTTSYAIGKVRIVYDGIDYHAHLRTPMLSAGFQHWKSLYEKEIAYARAICYALHVVAYGNYGQIIPPSATEYLTIKEYEKLKMEEQIAFKDATVDLDLIVKQA